MEGKHSYPHAVLPPAGALPARARWAAVPRALSRSTWLMLGALLVYLSVRLTVLPEFPIYFFTDEAAQTMHAYDLLGKNFHSPQGELLPTYFENGPQYNLSISVYLQVLPTLLFGKSIWVTRGTAALATLLAALSVGLILDRIFKIRFAWAGVLLLSLTPAWFLHSRTAFETALAASFYAAFLACYLIYRVGSDRALFGAVVFSALAFYTYSPMRVVMLVSAVLLFLSDLPYHLARRKILLFALGLCVLLALPLLRFLLLHPGATARHLELLGSYWLEDTSIAAKLSVLLGEYLRGLNPLYWYFPHELDLPRHTMRGYGHLLLPLLPLALLGTFLALCRVRDPRWRALLIALLAAPSGAAVVRLGITRALVMVIPMTLLTALALQAVLEWLCGRVRLSQNTLSAGAFLVLAAANLFILRDALDNGPFWYADYGLTGMQYGARQVFAEIASHLRGNPEDAVVLSPAWSNGTDVVARYFFDDPLPFELGSPRAFFEAQRPLNGNTLVVIIPEEYASLPRRRFSEVRVEKILRYPDGRPGFYFTRLRYVEDVQEMVAREKAEHMRRLTTMVNLGGQEVAISHPRLDIGSPAALFDGLPDTMVRSWAINPLVLDLAFPAPQKLRSVLLRIGGPPSEIEIRAWAEGSEDPYEITRSLGQSTVVRDTLLEFTETLQVTRLRISVANAGEPEDANVHLWEVTLQ